ncbi:hypothetical protein ANN_04058 [Periplaneta americana]|uniref:Uncharacterized protein n=1 Tax=Periplaneta americana TaxID=6978 RepID=A0ABQ8T9I7_PERAM|nr:hypothetical protein ANN_04058 [Periplaneta americana]
MRWKEEKKLAGSLVEKKLSSEGCTGRNGEREKSTGQKKISDDRRQLYAYKVQLVQALQPNNRPRRTAFAVDMLARIDAEEGFLLGQLHLGHVQSRPHLCFAAHCPFAAAHSQRINFRCQSRIFGRDGGSVP